MRARHAVASGTIAGMNANFATPEPDRASLDASAGPLLLEVGTAWCGHCRAAQPLIAGALAGHPGLRHLRIEDGPGRPLGRSYRVTLWPTLIFLRDGAERARLVRPTAAPALVDAVAAIEAA